MRTTLLHDRAVKLSTAEVHVFSDLVLCRGKIHAYPHSVKAWKQKIERFTRSVEYRELDCIDRELVEFEWTIFPIHSCFGKPKERWRRTEFNFKSSKIESSSCPLYNDIDWRKAENKETCISNSSEVNLKDIGHSSGQKRKKSGMKSTLTSETVCYN